MAQAKRTRQEQPLSLNPWDIDFDIQNPRDEDEDAIEGDLDFRRLKESILTHSVLVPLVVRPSDKDKNRWVLIDGERRLRAARAVNLKEVPVNVVRGDRSEALALAFHIHTLRKDWGNTAEVRAVRRMAKSAPRETRRKASALREWVEDLTGYGPDRVAKLLRTAKVYPEKVLDEVDAGKLRFSYLIQIEESFIAQIRSTFPRLLRRMGETKIREVMLDKARSKVLTDTRVLMDELVPIIIHRLTGTQERRYLEGLLLGFLTAPNRPIEEVVRQFNERYPPARDDVLQLGEAAVRIARQLTGVLDAVDAPHMRSHYPRKSQEVLSALRSLREVLGRVVRRLRR